MTNAIGTGTVNWTQNMCIDERRFWGRLCGTDTSLAEIKRNVEVRGLEAVCPDLANELKEIRRRYYACGKVGLFLMFMFLQFVPMAQGQASRRVTPPVRTVRAMRSTRRSRAEDCCLKP